MWVSKDYDPSFTVVYSLTLQDHKPNTLLIKNKRRGGYFKMFIECYKDGKVYFENMDIKNMSYEVFQMLMS